MADDRLANYEPVQGRLARFWTDHPDGRIDCELLEHDDRHVLAHARIWRHIDDEYPAAVGYAAEVHDGSPVNRQGWMIENAETSAIGRALANLGYAPSNARPSAEDMARVETRNRQSLADKALAQVTFDRLKMIAGTDTAVTVKALAAEHGKKLTLNALVADPAWRTTVDEHLDAHTEPLPTTQVVTEPCANLAQGSAKLGEPPAARGGGSGPPAALTAARGRAPAAALEQIHNAGGALGLTDVELDELAAAILGRDTVDITRLTKTSADKVLTALLAQVAEFTEPST